MARERDADGGRSQMKVRSIAALW